MNGWGERGLPGPPSARRAAWVLFAILLNLIPLELLGGARIFLGSFILVPLILGTCGRVLGAGLMLLPAIALAVTVPEAGFVAALWLGEAAWLAGRRRLAPLRLLGRSLVYWMLVSPLAWWWGVSGLGLPPEIVGLWLVVVIMNQLAAVVLGQLVIQHGRLLAEGDPAEVPLELRAVLLNAVLALTLVPLILTLFGFFLLLRSEGEAKTMQELRGAADRIGSELGVYLALHQAALQAIVEAAGRDREALQPLLAAHQQAYPGFITMLATDAAGRLVAGAPAPVFAPLRGSSVSDREYFTAARDSRLPHLSGVFQGRGFGQDLLIALSVPREDSGGLFGGVVQGSVEIGRFSEVVAGAIRRDDVECMILDRTGRVIYSTPGAKLRSLDQEANVQLAALRAQGASGALRYDDERQGRVRRWSGYASVQAETGMMVLVERPLLAPLASAGMLYALLGLIATGVALTGWYVARRGYRAFSYPLEHFARHAGSQAERAAVAAIPPPGPDRLSHEIELVYSSFNTLAARLEASYDELRQTNSELDARVVLRTAEAEQARQQAEAASAAKSRFLAITSHEIRTPLNAIIGLAEAMMEQTRDPVLADRARTIRDSGLLLLGVVNDLLDLASVEAGRFEMREAAFAVDEMCREVVKLFTPRAEQKGLRLMLRLRPAETEWVLGDGARLRQVLSNLVGNAVKFTPTGAVSVTLQRERLTDERVRLSFTVEDTGPGIPVERQAQLFQEFYRVDETAAATGTGLGLSISRAIVERMGGAIRVVSAAGEGAAFSFTLEVPRAAAPAVVEPAVRGPHVLVADDHPANQEVMEALLEGAYETLDIVSSGEQALARLAAKRFDLALIDLQMPGIDGFEVARRVTAWTGEEASRGCRLVAVSAYSRDQLFATCREAGFADYLEKPVDRRALLQLVRELRTRA